MGEANFYSFCKLYFKKKIEYTIAGCTVMTVKLRILSTVK